MHWINIKDQLPDTPCYYIVFMNNVLGREHEYTLDIAYYTAETGHDLCPWFDRSRNRLFGVTHWMDLPSLPENIKCDPEECYCEPKD